MQGASKSCDILLSKRPLFSVIGEGMITSTSSLLTTLSKTSRRLRFFPFLLLPLSLVTLPIMSGFRVPNASASASVTMDGRSLSSSFASTLQIDREYPGTAVQRMNAVRERVRSLAASTEHPHPLNGDWEEVRRKLLWAGGLRDLPDAIPGQGYTGHSFNDFNHVDLTTMLDEQAYNENKGQVEGIHFSNQLGPGVKVASLPELGPGGSWSTCMMGCAQEPPQDVAHVQFRSRIAFKLVW